MRKVTIQYDETGSFVVEDNDNIWVSVNMQDKEAAYVVSFLHGDEIAVAGSCHKDHAMASALRMMGVLV